MLQIAKAMSKNKKSQIEGLLGYKNILRLRVECTQILMQCWSFHGMVQWYHHLITARNLAVPLELRTNDDQKLLPSRFTVRDNALLMLSMIAVVMDGSELGRCHQSLAQQLLITDSHQIIFDNIFSSGSDDIKFSNHRSQENILHLRGHLMDLELTLLFDNEVSSLATLITLVQPLIMDNLDYVVQVGKFSLPCLEEYYTPVEMLYISLCIPSLNLYDKWSGKNLTISNTRAVIPKRMINHDNLLLDYNSLPKYLQNDKVSTGTRLCRTFIVHQHGLVLVAAA